MDVSEIDRQLRRKRAGHDLGQRQSFLVLRLRNPLPLLNQVAVHIANKGHWAAKSPRPQAERVANNLPQRVWQGRRRPRFNFGLTCIRDQVEPPAHK